MNWDAIGAISETVGAFAVVITLIYLAVQVRQSNSQQRREEIVSLQNSGNKLAEQLRDPALVRAYVRFADGNTPTNVIERADAIFWVIQYLNHFEIVLDLYQNGSLGTERYKHWETVALGFVAGKGSRAWWEESGRSAFPQKLSDVIDERLNDTDDPPVPINEAWDIFRIESWKDVELSTIKLDLNE
jgi:hypothetical protein